MKPATKSKASLKSYGAEQWGGSQRLRQLVRGQGLRASNLGKQFKQEEARVKRNIQRAETKTEFYTTTRPDLAYKNMWANRSNAAREYLHTLYNRQRLFLETGAHPNIPQLPVNMGWMT